MGREQDLDKIHTGLQSSQKKPFVIHGMGGIGKTELAKHYAADHQIDYPDGIAWLNFGSIGLAEEIVSFGRSHLKLSLQGENIEAQVKQVWADWAIESAALVIIDNLNRAQDYAVIKRLLPQRIDLQVLLTSRVRFGGLSAHNLEVLSLEKAVELLETLAGATEREWDHDLA